MRLQRKSSYLALVPALALAFATSSYAAGDADKRAATGTQPTVAATKSSSTSVQQMRASKLIGKNVTNSKGERLGEIKDLVVDTTNGNVQYAVIGMGGFLGVGDKLYAYPLERFERTTERGKLLLNVDKNKMKSAPGFDDKSWPDFGTAAYRGQVDAFYGTKSPTTARFARASQILKGDVKDRSNNDIGDIEDMVVSLPNGHVSYVVLEFDRAWNPNNKLVAMPVKALKSEDGDGTDLVYQADREALKTAPSFDKNQWPDLADGRFASDVNRYEQSWGSAPTAAATTSQPAARAGRAVERAADKVDREADRTVDRVTTPITKQ
jgi:sporulation protein YlmC with PRC-barrel domain